jgi:hypothetical protein
MHRIETERGHLKLPHLKQLPKMTSHLGLRLEAFRLRSRAKELVHRAETIARRRRTTENSPSRCRLRAIGPASRIQLPRQSTLRHVASFARG